jgi:DNA-binding GntR family transcriptional regulator
MKIERRTFMNTKVVEYTISYAKSDKMTFEVDLNG